MNKYPLLLLAFLFCVLNSFTKTSYPKDYFRSPVNFPIKLSGTFGELRPNHFHAGIDIKPSKHGQTGDPLLCVADGYVSRIKISSRGYGNALYIDHPNGYTSVYAHLQNFPKEIAKYIKNEQYMQQQSEMELYPPAYQLSFKKGEKIGEIGLSGRSYGAHLHFEIRDTRTEKPINPLLFGLKVRDNVPPKIQQLKVYELNNRRETIAAKIHNVGKWKNGYGLGGGKDTLTIGAWRVGLGVKAFDFMTGTSNWNGIYEMTVKVDGREHYRFEMETFSFDETRYLNAHIDYKERVKRKSYFNRCYQLPNNQLSIYPTTTNNGVIELEKNRAKEVVVIARDLEGNEAKMKFYVKRGEVDAPISPTYNYILPYSEESIIEQNDIRMYFPLNTFYETQYFSLTRSEDKSFDAYSDIYHIGDKTIPVHKYFEIGIRPTKEIPSHLRNKALVALCKKGGRSKGLGGRWENGRLIGESRDLGDFCILIDDTPPRITPISYKSNMRGFRKMSFKITDDLSGIKDYKAYVDGIWILMEYDAKKNLITHHFDGKIASGTHKLEVHVTDERGNLQVLKRMFTR